ncbi:adhesive plaque matrix protein-like [Larimichthys crocea]|uniref:adhesive plaque matrix protein-like n=1 Tax=Larimichthys crocea TaxID=215358 RepID=UPI000901E399|nr:adhesive plaque matrix protein-like [Larimichthys crocea]
MACKESGESRILLCLGLFLIASSFCQCTSLTKVKALNKLSQVKGGELRHGKLLIWHNSLQGAKLKGTKAAKNLLDVDTDYQADMAWGQPKQPKENGPTADNAAVERLLKMEPKVECTGDSMKLQVQDAASTPGSLFFVDRGSLLSPLPLSKLPPSCGYTIKSTRREFVLVAPYDGCFVALEEGSYILPLLWLGLPMRMSCPSMRQSTTNPPMVTCHAEGMVIKIEGTLPVSRIKVNLNDNWEPLMKVSPRCAFSVVVHPDGVVISVRYAPCLEKKGEMYSLELAGDGETKISCPPLSPAQLEPSKSPGNGQKTQTKTPNKGVYPTTPSHSFSTNAPEPTPKNPQNPEVPDEPNQGPKDVYPPQLPYSPYYPNFFYPYPANPDIKPTPTVQPIPSVTKKNGKYQQIQTVPPTKLPLNPEGQVPQLFSPLPFYPSPTQAEKVPVEKETTPQPTTQQPNGQEKQPFYPYPFYFTYPPMPENPFFNTEKQLPEDPVQTKQPGSEEPKVEIDQPLYPYPFLPQGPYQMPVPPPLQIPTPGPFYLPPTTKPTIAPQPETPQGQVRQPLYPNPFYPQSKPESPPAIKPTIAPKPPQPEAPQGQEYQPLYPNPFYKPFYPLPEPEIQPAKKPTIAPKPPQPEAPQGQVYQPLYPNPFYPQSKPENPPAIKPTIAPKPPQPEAPQGQEYQPLYPNPFYKPFYPLPEPENPPAIKPTASPKPPHPEAPQGQVYQPLYPNPFYPQLKPENPSAIKPTIAPKPPQPEAPQGQVHQPLYPNPFYPQPEPEKPPAIKPTIAPKPEAPQSQVYQPIYPNPFYYNPFYPLPVPEKPTAVPKLPAMETTMGQVHGPSYPQPFTIPGAGDNTPNKKPVQIEQPPAVKPSPQPLTLPPAIYMQQPQQVTTQNPVYCPEFCKFGFSHCCPQIAFHQHLHHIVPAEPGSKGAPSLYPGLPFLPSAYSGFGNSFGSAPLPQKPTEATTQATTTSTSAPVSTQSLQFGDQIKQSYLQPLDGNPSTLPTSNPSKLMNSKPVNPYFVPNSLYPNWQHLPQNQLNLLHRQSPAYYSMLSKLQASSNEPLSPLTVGDINNQKPSESEGPSQPIVQSKYDHDLVPYYMLQDAQAPASKSAVPNNSSQLQPFVSGSNKSERHEQSYVLLQHGPPGREPNRFIESPLSFRDMVYDANFLAQNAARHHGSKPGHPQNLSPPQEKTQPPNWLQKGMSSALPGNVNYMARQLHVPGKEFQPWRSASRHQTNGLNQPIQRPGGKQE